MTNYTNLSDVIVQGKVYSSVQGDMIGSRTSMPAAAEASGQTILYLGSTTAEFTKGKYYYSDGTSWSMSPASAVDVNITVDSALSASSTNPVQNKVVSEKFTEIDGKLANVESGGQENVIEKITVNDADVPVSAKTAKITISKSTVGLDKVSNTADADKPVSAAQQTALDKKVDKVTGKGLSTNDLTAARLSKLNGIEEKAEVNIIEGIKVNNTALTPDSNRSVNIDLSDYATKGDLSSIPKFAIQVVSGDLPSSGISTSTIYLKSHGGSESDNVYDEYIYVNSKWELIGTTKADLTQYALKTEVQTKQDKAVFAQNVSISWTSDTSVQGYSFKGTATVSGMTADHEPTVCFDAAQATSGDYCPIAESGAGVVYIWSKKDAATTVPVISGILKA